MDGFPDRVVGNIWAMLQERGHIGFEIALIGRVYNATYGSYLYPDRLGLKTMGDVLVHAKLRNYCEIFDYGKSVRFRMESSPFTTTRTPRYGYANMRASTGTRIAPGTSSGGDSGTPSDDTDDQERSNGAQHRCKQSPYRTASDISSSFGSSSEAKGLPTKKLEMSPTTGQGTSSTGAFPRNTWVNSVKEEPKKAEFRPYVSEVKSLSKAHIQEIKDNKPQNFDVGKQRGRRLMEGYRLCTLGCGTAIFVGEKYKALKNWHLNTNNIEHKETCPKNEELLTFYINYHAARGKMKHDPPTPAVYDETCRMKKSKKGFQYGVGGFDLPPSQAKMERAKKLKKKQEAEENKEAEEKKNEH